MAIIFISGGMKGYPDFNRSAFYEAETKLTEAGHVVLNPAWLPDGMEDEQYVAIDTAMLLHADAIYMLDGWNQSRGASAEWHMAERVGKLIYSQDNLSDNKALGISCCREESDGENEVREDNTDEDEEGIAEFDSTIKIVAPDEPSCDTDGLSWETIREYIDFADEHFDSQESADRFISNMIRFENWRNCDYDASFWGIDGEDEE